MSDDPRVEAAAVEICGANHECPSAIRGRCYDCQYRARAALNAADKAAWRPISEAPKDGTPVLLCAEGDEIFVGYFGYVGRFTSSPKMWLGHEWGAHADQDVVGWMSLPAPPSGD